MAEKASSLLDINTTARFYMDETKKITEREKAVEAIHKLWNYHNQMEKLAQTRAEGDQHPAILDIVRREILRLKTTFGITTEEELAEPQI